MRGNMKAWMLAVLLPVFLAACCAPSLGETAADPEGISIEWLVTEQDEPGTGLPEVEADAAEDSAPETGLSEAGQTSAGPETVAAEPAPSATEAAGQPDEPTGNPEEAEASGEAENDPEKEKTEAVRARDITDQCTFRLSALQANARKIKDGAYTTYWDSYTCSNPWVTIHSKEPMYGLYLCFRKLPDSFEIQAPGTEEGTWVTLTEGDARFHHSFYPLEGLTDLRIWSTQEDAHQMGFNEIFVFGEGEIPDWVQRWEPQEEKADILFLVAHPDDEILFFGGAIPTYAAQGKRVVVAYLSYSNKTRRSESLNGLWTMGVRHYPEFGSFRDSYSSKAAVAYKRLGESNVLAWVAELFRKYRPEVVLTHDMSGEYGHGQHRMLADAAVRCYDLAADPEKYPESAAAYGPWQVKKLYLHLWGEETDRTHFDWNQPLAGLGGKTSLDIAKDAYAMHITQTYAEIKVGRKWHRLSVQETGRLYDNTFFGLYASQVGPDVGHDDLLEHID